MCETDINTKYIADQVAKGGSETYTHFREFQPKPEYRTCRGKRMGAFPMRVCPWIGIFISRQLLYAAIQQTFILSKGIRHELQY